MPHDGQFITGELPAEMREGVDMGDPEIPGVRVTTTQPMGDDGGIVQVRIPRPAHIPPPNPASMPPGYEFKPTPTATQIAQGVLTYDFPLLPGVQSHIALVGPATADHLEQLVDYLSVAVKRLREQEKRDAAAKLEAGPAPGGSKGRKGKAQEQENG